MKLQNPLKPLNQQESDLYLKIREFPKTELHVHLEAAVPAELYQQWGHYPVMPSQRAPFSSLQDFIKAWMDNSKLIKNEDAFVTLAEEFVAHRALQNIVYTEVHCSPVDVGYMRERFPEYGEPLLFSEVLLCILRGLKNSRHQFPKIDVRLIIDVLWPTTAEQKEKFLVPLKSVLAHELNQSAFGGNVIVGIGMGGPQRADLAESFLSFVHQIRNLNLKLDLHCGETGTAEEMEFILGILQPDRISHGIACGEHIPNSLFSGHIAACPLSNIFTGSFKGDLQSHPILHWLKEGRSVSLNTDDPLLFQTDLSLEFLVLSRALHLGFEDFLKLQSHAQNAAFQSACKL